MRLLFILLLLSCSVCIVKINAQQPAKKWNVLFISADDLNTDIGAYGHPLVKTPHMDRLAKRAVLFRRAYCQYPLCNPSRASIMTGMNPDKTKVYDLVTRFRKTLPDVITLPQLFMNNGYYSARVGKIFHYGVPGGIGKNGLDDSVSWHQRINPKGRDIDDEAKLTRLLPNSIGLGANLAYLEAEGKDEEQTDGKVATETIRLLAEHKNESFFIAAGFYRPHLPFIAPKKYFDLYPLEKIRLPSMPAGDLDDIPQAALFTKPANWGLSEEQQKQTIRGYYATISFMDAQIGRLLDALDSLRLSDKTIIVVWSDHGYNLGEHGQWQKRSLFEKSAGVPLLIAVPGGQEKVCDRTVQLVDIYPTLARLCGFSINKELSGNDLGPLLADPGMHWDKAAYSQLSLGDGSGNLITRSLPGFDETKTPLRLDSLNIMGRSVRTERFRYTEWDHGRQGAELYDEMNDPGEYINLAKDKRYKKKVKELSALLNKHFGMQ